MSRKIFFLSFLLTIGLSVFAQPVIHFNSKINGKYIGKNVSVFQDSSQKLSFNQVKNSPSLFINHTSDVLNLGVTPYDNWVRFTVKNDTKLSKVILSISNPAVDKVSLYSIIDGNVDSTVVTESDPIRSRQYKHQYFIFDIPIKSGESAVCYLKFKSNKQILAPITLNSGESILSAVTQSDTLSGIYLGIMIVMLLYNLFIYFSARDKHYLDYVHYIFWVTITQAALLGYVHKFLIQENVWLNDRILTFTGAMSGIATIIFVKAFLRTKHFVPRLHPFLNLIILGDLIAIGFLLFGSPLISYQIVNVTAGLGSPFVVIVAYFVYRKDYKPARFFLYAWSVFLGSVLVFVLKDYGILPYNLFTIHSVQIGSALEAVLLSFALADKINILKKEKEDSQAKALEVAKENERIIREQNLMLEVKVNERTYELQQSNEELNITLENLKETQLQLVESEKMASLGQLTAGIAHEINNPINFVTSNIGPLKRDVGILFEAISAIEEVGFSDKTLSEKQNEIEEYKEEIDFDYLKIEINHLLRGINEGATRTAEIVKGLRVFSRVDEDDLKRADINDGLESTLVLVNNLLDNKIKVVTEFEKLPQIECYPGKLNQVFLNIISNAIHAMHKQHGSEPNGVLRVSTTSDENNVFVKIEDNGTGMDENTKKKIFEPFFTTKGVGEGTGLGMSISYNTIKKHNGIITINSTLGLGTEFILELPIIHTINN